MKKLVWLFAVATLVAAAAYSIVSLNRWEWTRALYFGLVALLAEVAVATALVLRRLDRMSEADRDERDEVRAILQQERTPRDRFAWLSREKIASRTHVFITMLVSGGIVLSALAWVLDRIAASTTTSLEEGRLAGDLTSIAYPPDGLLPDDVTVLAQSVPELEDPQLRLLLGRDLGRQR